jgi:uncharacterized phage protein (TIGR01671 family)
MKSEIKFRAWDTMAHKMEPVGEITFDTGLEVAIGNQNGKTRSVNVQYQPHIILMQYTGLHDKNGREVYEGDIVNVHRVVLSPGDRIGWVEYTAKYGYSIRFGNRSCRQSDWANDEGAKYEVIGNIFDNPELLEAEK